MESYTQLGIAGVTLGILFFIVRYFVSALTKQGDRHYELTEKFIQLSKDNIESHHRLADSIDANVKSNELLAKATKDSNEQVALATKESGDKLTTLLMKAIKNNNKK
jgi:hypothetical protein